MPLILHVVHQWRRYCTCKNMLILLEHYEALDFNNQCFIQNSIQKHERIPNLVIGLGKKEQCRTNDPQKEDCTC